MLAHLASGVGNLVLATPLLIALSELGFAVDLRLDADYPQAIALFEGWSILRCIRGGAFPGRLGEYWRVLPAVPPFYWGRFAGLYRGVRNVVSRPPDSLFYGNEQAYYLAFAEALGFAGSPEYRLPIAPRADASVSAATVVLAPGCKTGEMAAKRWPYFPELAARIADVAVVGTPDDLGEKPFPPHCRSFVGKLSLRETAELMAGAGLVIGNDAGLSHVAAAVGTPTLMLFGPTADKVLGAFPTHVTVLRSGLPCEPCWTTARLQACERRIDCLQQMGVDAVWDAARRLHPL